MGKMVQNISGMEGLVQIPLIINFFQKIIIFNQRFSFRWDRGTFELCKPNFKKTAISSCAELELNVLKSQK